MGKRMGSSGSTMSGLVSVGDGGEGSRGLIGRSAWPVATRILCATIVLIHGDTAAARNTPVMQLSGYGTGISTLFLRLSATSSMLSKQLACT